VDVDPGAYAKQVEDYLARRNRGHLIRIVGPAFDLVVGWQQRGVPVNVVCRGIDRYCERVEAKGRSRRPAQIQFCEADVLDVFDEWRRATGVSMWDNASVLSGTEGAASRDSLPAHLERLVARLTALRSSAQPGLGERVDAIVREIDVSRASAKGLRGDARARFLQRLRELDVALLSAAREHVQFAVLQSLDVEAEAELAPFRERMPREAYERSRAAAAERLLRERLKLPVIALD
jgi:hypothetical protein